jgi:hypothetical protein
MLYPGLAEIHWTLKPKMIAPPEITPTGTFVVRIWLEASLSGPHWRGYILEVSSGRKTWFLELAVVEAFIRQAIEPGEDDPTKKPGSPLA